MNSNNRNTFNRQVLEQVAKDGITYKALAKDMARALLSSKKETRDDCLCISPICLYTKNPGEVVPEEIGRFAKMKGAHLVVLEPVSIDHVNGMRLHCGSILIIPPQDL